MPAPHPRMHGISHVPGGPDPIPGMARIPAGDTIDAVIEALDPAGFWKLNESSGTTAFDSSGNGLDLTVPSGRATPGWGQPAGPPGEQAADMSTGGPSSTTYSSLRRAWASLTGPFTAGIFVSFTGAGICQVMGQGNPGHGGSSLGWEIGLNVFDKPYLGGAFGPDIQADNPVDPDVWVFLTVVKDGATAASSTWRFYVNGLEQGTPYTGSYTADSSGGLWIGSKDGIHSFTDVAGYFVGSYAFMIPSALSAAEILDIYESATIPEGANSGKVLTATGLGGTSWEFPIEVTY